MSNNKNREINCHIVCDLLPLYHDGVVRDNTKLAIEEHLNECKSCKQEYEELLVELPIDSTENSTKSKFKVMINKQRLKRISILITSIVLSCVLVVSVIVGLTEIPIVQIPNEEIKIHRIYGYEGEDGYEFFLLFNANTYGKMLFELGEYEDTIQKDGIQTLDFKKPIISDRYDSRDEIWTFKIPKEYAKELNSLSFRGKVIWSKADANQKIPEYVFEYISNLYKGDWITTDLDVSKDYIRISYEDNSYKEWTIDGELIEQSDK